MTKRGLKILNLSALIVGIISFIVLIVVGTVMKPTKAEKHDANVKIERRYGAQKLVTDEKELNEFAAMQQVDKKIKKSQLKYYPTFRKQNPKMVIPNVPGQLTDAQKLEAQQAANIWTPYYKSIHQQLTKHKATYYSEATQNRLHIRHNLLWGFGLIFLVCVVILFASWII